MTEKDLIVEGMIAMGMIAKVTTGTLDLMFLATVVLGSLMALLILMEDTMQMDSTGIKLRKDQNGLHMYRVDVYPL